MAVPSSFTGWIVGVLFALPASAQETPVRAADSGDAAQQVAPSLVLITLDTVRADHLGCYGYPRPTTPSIDALAAESVVFDRCYSVFPRTTPSHCSILTGVYPFEHGVTEWTFRKSEEVMEARAFQSTPQLHSYAEIAAQKGWHTGGFVSATVVKRVTGLAAGFQDWTEPQGKVRIGEETVGDALRWLESVPEPFFLWVHLFDAHKPPRHTNRKYLRQFALDDAARKILEQRDVSSSLDEMTDDTKDVPPDEAIVQYDAGIRILDDHVLALRKALERRGCWPRTTFVVTSDHGEGLGQHRTMSHGPVWNEQIRVPLVIHVPGRAAARIPRVISSIDLLATAVELTPGLPAEEFLTQARGRNAAAEDFDERPVFSMSSRAYGESSLTTSRWKFIARASGDHALFDLEKDPFERNDLRSTFPEVAAGFDRQLGALIREQKLRRRYYAGDDAGVDLTAEERAALRDELEALGYAEDDDH